MPNHNLKTNPKATAARQAAAHPVAMLGRDIADQGPKFTGVPSSSTALAAHAQPSAAAPAATAPASAAPATGDLPVPEPRITIEQLLRQVAAAREVTSLSSAVAAHAERIALCEREVLAALAPILQRHRCRLGTVQEIVDGQAGPTRVVVFAND
jgi:hypothetical protein